MCTFSKNYSTGEFSATCEAGPLSNLVCAVCRGPMRIYNRPGAGVSASQRTVAWVSPDGTRVANLDEPHGIGPQGRMYAAEGWNRVECDTIQKLDRINAIRTAQKTAEAGHEVISHYDVADYDAASMQRQNQELAAIDAGHAEGDFLLDTPKVPDIIPTS